MKKLITTILAILALSGLVMCGGDSTSNSIMVQFLASSIGVLIFGASTYIIIAIHREE